MIHPRRRARLTDLANLDPTTDWHEIYRRTVLWEFPREALLGFQLAFFRTFAVPRMARVLSGSGHFLNDTTRRTYDTAIVMNEIIYGGIDSKRGQKMVRLMNALHDRRGIEQRDLSYVLNALIVVPIRFIQRTGWRPLTAAEVTAAWRFYVELGQRMNIDLLPVDFAAAEEYLRKYEADNLAPSHEGGALSAAVVTSLAEDLPRPVRPFAAQVMSALIGDFQVSDAAGLPRPSGWITLAANRALSARRLLDRVLPPSDPSVLPGQPVGTLYPHGYDIDQIGPRSRRTVR